MRKASMWSLAILILLLLYFVATIIFSYLFQTLDPPVGFSDTPVPESTFTATLPPTQIVIAATPIPVEPTFTPGPTAVPTATSLPPTTTPTEPAPATVTTVAVSPEVRAATIVNIRSGPGTTFEVIATLPPNVPLPIIGRNATGTWWQIEGPDGDRGWVADSVVTVRNVAEVPVVAAPVPPTAAVPTATPVPTQAAYQYTPTGWFDDTNYGLTRFLGTITDLDGNPVNNVQVEAQCGDFRVLSNPSGTTGWPPGFYDLTLDTKPIPCAWRLTVVSSADGVTASGRLSESVEVVTTVDSSIVTANWQKNW